MLKGVCRNCNIFISEVKNNCYDIKIVHQYNDDILILIKISLSRKSQRGLVSPQREHSSFNTKLNFS